MSEIRLLPGMKFMLGSVLYRPGDILPDTEETRGLIKRKKAEWIEKEASSVPTEGYEIETVKTLVTLARKREIDIPKGTNKAGIIELLEVWDAEQAEDGDDEGDA
ncbi:MAG: hypothetical protein LBG12_02765 [Synergistaceae bacterium]|jgi:hypothetical protein|nr:hypothetical protein [Synergistaceae bacterium]